MSDSPPHGSVLLICEPLNPGGIAVYTRSILTGLSQSAWSYVLLTSTAPAPGLLEPEQLARVQVVPGLFWSAWRPFVFRNIAAWAARQQPALIHGLSALANPLCARLAEVLEIPYVVSVHHFQKKGVLRVEKRCHAFIAVSESLRENMVNDAHIPKELVRIIPAGIKTPAVPQIRPADQLEPGAATVPLVTSIGKLIQRKDFATFLRAARMVLDSAGRECSFVICGEGPEEPALRKLARDLKIEKHVTFSHGNTAIEPLLRDTDVYVQCSRSEGFGTMVLQAMAQSTAVVATSTGGMLSLIKEGETGFLFPAGDAEELADRVLRLLKNPALCRRMGEAARQTAFDAFNIDTMMAQTRALYEEAIAVQPVRA